MMPRLIDKKNKIIIYLLFLFILSTTNIKLVTNQTNYSSIINKINIKGLSNVDNKKIFNQLNNLFYKNILLVDDTCYTGTTLTTVKEHLLGIGALSVKTYCLYSSITGNEGIIDYYSSYLGLPN